MKSTTIPDWASRCLAVPCKSNSVPIDNARVHYRTWGSPANPGVVLVHGNRANSSWWDFFAPLLSDRFYVVAIDLSGMGDSDRRETYSAEAYAREVMGVAANVIPGKAMLVGHSMGGKIALLAGNLYSAQIAGVVMLDSPCYQGELMPKESSKARVNRAYKSESDIKSRFRLVPEQPCENMFILDHIARNSIREVNGSWIWKYDHKVEDTVSFRQLVCELPSSECPVLGLICGEFSKLFTPEVLEYCRKLLAGRAPVIVIQNSAHHLIFDQPLLVVSNVRRLLTVCAES